MKIRIVGILLMVACKSAEQKQAEGAVRQLQEAGRQMGAAIGAAAGTAAGTVAGALANVKASEPVDFRDLKALLPDDLPGMKRSSAEGEKAGAVGFVASYSEGRYESDDGSSIRVKITDMGAVTGVAALAAVAWATMEVDRETASGYEKTTTYKGYRGYEKYDRDSKYGELNLLVASRFIVETEGRGVDMDALKAAVDKLDLGKLEGMKNVGVP